MTDRHFTDFFFDKMNYTKRIGSVGLEGGFYNTKYKG